jgi:hypothetical protein
VVQPGAQSDVRPGWRPASGPTSTGNDEEIRKRASQGALGQRRMSLPFSVESLMVRLKMLLRSPKKGLPDIPLQPSVWQGFDALLIK